MSNTMTTLGGRMEQRFVHALARGGGEIQKRAYVMLGRTSRTVRRGSIVLALGWLGLALFAAAWVLLNLALHSWLANRWSLVTAHLVVMGVNLCGGGALVLVAAVLAPTVEKQLHARRRHYPVRQLSHARTHAPFVQVQPPMPAVQVHSEPRPPVDSIDSALGAAIELGMLAAQTVPQIVRVFRRPPKRDAMERVSG